MDCRFCFPVKIDLDHRDYLKFFIVGLHFSSFSILLISIGQFWGFLALGGAMVSLRYYFEQQNTINKYDELQGLGVNQWQLVRWDGQTCSVHLEQIAIIGPFLIIKLKRYGESISWVTTAACQSKHHWHKMRVLARFN